jgi:hypothetical protein
MFPGPVNVYHCPKCKKDFRYLEIHEEDLNNLKIELEKKRQQWIREEAALRERLHVMTQPYDHAGQKLLEIRATLLTLLNKTF